MISMVQNDDVNSVLSRLQECNRLMESLIDLAMEDTKMTEDEKNILFSINKNLETYARTIMESISDNEISEEEWDKLDKIETKILDEANSIANSDDKISEEEKTLLNQLIDSIKSVRKL